MRGVKTALLLWERGKKTRGTSPGQPCEPLTRANVWGIVSRSFMSENCSVAVCVCVCARARALGDYVRASTSEAWVSRRAQHNVIERRLMFGRWSRKRLPEESCQTPSTLLLPFSRLLTLEIIKMKYRDATRKWSLSFDHWKVDRLFISQILWIGGHLIRDINRISEEILCPLFWRCSGYFWPNLSVMDEKLGVLFLMSF